jgi:hypothetical protein
VLLGSRFQAIDVMAVGVFDFAAALAVFRAEQVAEDGEEPRGHIRSRLERTDIGHVTQQGSCTRSSARSTLPLSEIANARKLGTAASMASRTDG